MPLGVITSKYSKMDDHLRDMDDAGVDVAVLSTAVMMEWLNIEASRLVNDKLAETVRNYPDRVIGLAHVPPLSEDSVAEVDRAIKDLRLNGVAIPSHCEGKYLDEDDRYTPFLRKVNELNVPIYIHPSPAPAEYSKLTKFGLYRYPGRAFELCLLTIRILYSGLLGKYPNLRFIISHTGGVFFALISHFTATRLGKPDIPLDEYLSRMYFDTAARQSEPELALAVNSLGPERLVLGSDYPYKFDLMKKSVTFVKQLDLPEEKKQAILGGNAEKLFNRR